MSRIDYKFTLFPQTLSHSPCRVYTYNRLDSVIYPDNPQNNVRYTYGDSTAANNQRGRIALLEDASGFQTFKYGRMGEVIENNRTFVLPNESYPYSFKMQYTYDSWNRVQDITYPDGEVVKYVYNSGGMIYRVYGEKTVVNSESSSGRTRDLPPASPPSTYVYHYIDSIHYNEFELKAAQWYGNGTRSLYVYDTLLRLSNLKLYNAISRPQLLQNISYTYDRVGNITRIQNTSRALYSLGGQYDCRYEYDSLYRLTLAADTSHGTTGIIGRYGQSMSYFSDGRIQTKQDETWAPSSSLSSVSNTYIYGNSNQPHTLTSTVNVNGTATTYTWDANGNMTKQGNRLRLQWDEENRLKKVDKTTLGACYFYDAFGERFYKNVGDKYNLLVNGSYYANIPLYADPVLYASPYLVVTHNGYTKHYFIDNERFASRIGDGSFSGLNTHATTNVIIATKQSTVNRLAPDSISPNQFVFLRSLSAHWSDHHTTFWQHSDHLGSASWITDTNGMGYQHIQYKAWGEPFIDQRVSGANYEARYTFSGKERDEETGFSYFGARLHNPSLSLWLSVDPLSDKYPGVSPYAYCANNPVRYFDPNGREKIDALANTEQNKRHKKACQRYPENDGVIHLWAHGCMNSIDLSGTIKTDVKDIVGYLYLTSKTYQQNANEGKTSILVLHSCKTGQGDENIAQKISAESNLLVVAPTENVHIAIADYGKPWETDIECGTYEGRTYPVTGKEIHRDITRNGYWKIYYKGVVVDSFSGLTKPIFKNPQAIIEKYEKIYQQKTNEAGQ